MELTEKQMNYIIKRVRQWDKAHIDYIELKSSVERCIDFDFYIGIITNKIYIGIITNKNEKKKGIHETFITEKQFERINK